MKKEYDFSKGIRGKIYRPNKIQKTIRLDEDIIYHFQEMAQLKHTGYQTLINQSLRKSMEHPEGTIDSKTLKKELRSTLRSVLKDAKLTKA